MKPIWRRAVASLRVRSPLWQSALSSRTEVILLGKNLLGGFAGVFGYGRFLRPMLRSDVL